MLLNLVSDTVVLVEKAACGRFVQKVSAGETSAGAAGGTSWVMTFPRWSVITPPAD